MAAAIVDLRIFTTIEDSLYVVEDHVRQPEHIFQSYLEWVLNVHGWFQPEAAAIWDSLLTAQEQSVRGSEAQTGTGIVGDLLEIGVWKGRSASMMALHCRPQESCVFVDYQSLDDVRLLIEEKLPDVSCHYIQSSSDAILGCPNIKDRQKTYRWIHIDGEHSYEATSGDLLLSETLLNRGGIIIVDDFFSVQYPQVTQAVFDFFRCNPGKLIPLIAGFNKIYLCRPLMVHHYAQYIENSLLEDLGSRMDKLFTLYKTSPYTDFGFYGVTHKTDSFTKRGPDWIVGHVLEPTKGQF